MKKKIILDLCGGTGSWSKPYADAGYTVHNITLPEYDIKNFISIPADGELRYYLDNAHIGIYKVFEIKNIYGILAAPPCDQFSIARNRHKTPRDLTGAFEIVKKCLEIIWICSLCGNLKFWCLENPKGLLVHLLGKPPFKFERWEFGDPGAKMTYLWGDFNAPKKKPNLNLRDTRYVNQTGYSKIKIPITYRRIKGDCIKKIKRAMTSPGFANAFFKANK